MAVIAQGPLTGVPGSPESAVPAAFMQFFAEVCSTPAVRHFSVVAEDIVHGLSIWVRLDQDDDDQEERIYRALQAYRASGQGLPVDLHVVFASEPDAVFPGDAIVLYTRR